MKHFRILLPILILAMVLSACGSTSQEPYTCTFSRNDQVKTLTVNPESGTILDGADVYDYEVEKSGSRTSYVITYPNGATYHWTASKHGGAGGWSDDYDDINYVSGGTLVNAIEESLPREKVGNPVMGLGSLNFFLPELPFYLRYGWAVENAEPSDAYITMTKFGGILAAVAGLVWCII